MKAIFTSFDQNNAKFYDNHTLLTMICIFLPEFGLKPLYFALHVTEYGKVFKYCSPLSYEIILTVMIAR